MLGSSLRKVNCKTSTDPFQSTNNEGSMFSLQEETRVASVWPNLDIVSNLAAQKVIIIR